MNPDQAAALRAPFAPEQIGKLPKGGTTLDFVGHAAVTDRLLQVDPEWSWEPLAYAEDGGPLIRYGAKEASLWLKITICGVTRIGVGTAPLGAFELDKQLISDGIRNVSMRYGVGLDLWSREPLAVEVPPFDPEVDADAAEVKRLKDRIDALNDDVRAAFTEWKAGHSFPWPWPVRACHLMHAELDHLEEVLNQPSDHEPTAGYAPGEEPF